MIDIYSLINSKTVEKHCRAINHQYNTKEIAVLIHRCDKLYIDEKLKYYKEILAHPEIYPEMTDIKNHNIGYWGKMSELLKEEIEIINFVVNEFHKIENDTVYTLQYIQESDGRYFDQGGIFKTLKDVHKYIKIEGCDEEFWSGYAIRKRYLNSSFDTRYNDDDYIKMFYTRKSKKKFVLSDFEYHKDIFEPKRNTESILGEIWIYVPTPFKEGDIVDTRSQYGKGVIEYLCTQDEDFVKKADSGDNFSDSSDMTCYCYFLHDDHVYWEYCHAYDRMEYVNPEDLEGFERILITISNLMKKEFGADLFLDAYNFMKAEYALKESKVRGYTDEGLKLAGIF